MALSLPLRINLISLVFASVVAAALTGSGGVLLHRQQSHNAVTHARLAADELAARAAQLLALELRVADFLDFDAQCRAVVRDDALLRDAALFDANRTLRSRGGAASMAWPAGLAAASDAAVRVVETPGGPAVVRPVMHRGRVEAYAVAAVDGDAVVAATLRVVGWLVAAAVGVFAGGVAIQQYVFWRTVGRPLAELVRLADGIRPDDSASLRAFEEAADADDDIGRLNGAFARLIRRLLDARIRLLRHNVVLEETVRRRTEELERANAALARDIERRKALEENLITQANTDALTGLANRAFILPYLRTRIDQARRDGTGFGLALFDFDGFKLINDHYGHAVGDEVLRVMGRRIQQICRSSDVLARLGGDEFVLAFEGFQNEAQVSALARRLVQVFDTPISVDGRYVKVGVSLGIALFPQHGDGVDSLMAAADATMYRVKQRGGGFDFVAGTSAPGRDSGASVSGGTRGPC